MKITNKHNLPTPYVKAATPFSPSEEGRFRVSDLITPPQISALYRAHFDELEEDVVDRLWALAGQSKHYVLEQYEGDNVMTETPLAHTIGNCLITGTCDVYENGVLSDYKNTSVWTVLKLMKDINDRPDYVKQVNYYRFLFTHCFPDLPIEKLQIVAECKDWRPGEAKKSSDYPARIEVIEVPMWDLADTANQLTKDLTDHINAREGNLRPCTDEERWKRPDEWAVMKQGRKSALRVRQSEEDAHHWMQENTPSTANNGMYYIEKRPGAYVRCEEYCPVAGFCPQFKGE